MWARDTRGETSVAPPARCARRSSTFLRVIFISKRWCDALPVSNTPPDPSPAPSLDSRRHGRPPLRILCQHDTGSCAACCGLYNFVDRSAASTDRRLRRRTAAVRRAWPNVDALREARDTLLASEAPDYLFNGVKVCPFAGYVDDTDDDTDDDDEVEPKANLDPGRRVGCLIHPLRHPTGEDLRDLAVYPKEVCAGHFCAPHDWLREREVAAAQTARHGRYGLVVTDAGLVKAVLRAVDDLAHTTATVVAIKRATSAFDDLWRLLVETWPFRDPDPRRFGGFFVDGDEANERSLPSCLAGVDSDATSAERSILDAIATRPLDAGSAEAALVCLRASLGDVVDAMASASPE